ncbi:MAG: DNA polymerase I, partial [Clostridiales bacterium]|nr:DNA polymerase I [Clostridiales bacterium]
MAKIMLLDGNSLINRAFYAVPLLTNKSGEYTNAVYGFLNIFFKLMDEEAPEHIAVAFDLPLPTVRHLKYSAYKGTRKTMPEELRGQLPMLKALLRLMSVRLYEKEGFEADDLLGTLAKRYEENGYDVVLVSGDRDLLQIASDKTKIRIPKTKAGKTEVEDYYQADLFALYGVTPAEYIDVKALMGDASDNIPGVPGIGEKTAFKIIREYHSIENALAHAGEITPKKASENLTAFSDTAILSKDLATILTDVPVDPAFDETKTDKARLYNGEAYQEMQRLGFKSFFARFTAEEPPDGQPPMPYDSIATAAVCDKAVAALMQKEIVAYKLFYNGRKITGLSLCAENGRAVVIGDSTLLENCRAFFESDVKKIALDLKKDLVALHAHGIDVKNAVFDAMLAGYILNASKDKYDYNDIAFEFLNETYPGDEEFFGKGTKRKTETEIGSAALFDYYARQADVIFRSYPVMEQMVRQNGQTDLYYRIELPLVYVLRDMEIHGIKVDKEALINYGA